MCSSDRQQIAHNFNANPKFQICMPMSERLPEHFIIQYLSIFIFFLKGCSKNIFYSQYNYTKYSKKTSPSSVKISILNKFQSSKYAA